MRGRGSNDFDFIQLVNEFIVVLRTYHGVVTKFDETTVVKMFGINPSQYLDYLAMKGDVSDNIKGINGIGRKRAVSLLTEYRDIEGIYKSLDNLPRGLQELLSGREKFLQDQRKFLRIKTEVSLCQERSSGVYEFSKKIVPEKMGAFLGSNWDEILSRSKNCS